MHEYHKPKVLIVHGMDCLRDEYVEAFKVTREYDIYTARLAEVGKSMYVPFGIRDNGVIIMDPYLTGCDEALEEIRSRDSNPKIIVLHKDHTPENVVSQADRLLGREKPSLTERVMAKLSIPA